MTNLNMIIMKKSIILTMIKIQFNHLWVKYEKKKGGVLFFIKKIEIENDRLYMLVAQKKILLQEIF